MLLSYCTDISRKAERGGGRGVDGGAPSTRTADTVLRDVTEGDLAIVSGPIGLGLYRILYMDFREFHF